MRYLFIGLVMFGLMLSSVVSFASDYPIIEKSEINFVDNDFDMVDHFTINSNDSVLIFIKLDELGFDPDGLVKLKAIQYTNDWKSKKKNLNFNTQKSLDLNCLIRIM